MTEGEIWAAVPDDDESWTGRRYDPEADTWGSTGGGVRWRNDPDTEVVVNAVEGDGEPLLTQQDGSLYVEYSAGGVYSVPPRLSWWRRILYRIALNGQEQ